MARSSKLEHVKLRVEQFDEALKFYTDVMGLTTIDERGGTVYLGCGLDENFDLAVEKGGTGLDHFAIRVAEGDTDRYERRLVERNIPHERTDGCEPNVEHGLRFDIPVGATMELVEVADKQYHHSNEARLDKRTSVTPLDADHVTLGCETIEENVDFLEAAADFDVSEVLEKEDSSWRGAFTRHGDWHHDVGFIGGEQDEYDFRHIAWTMASLDHMKSFIDHISRAGYQLEVTVHRHYAGDNLAAYFVEPGGNRFEICAEMATLDPDTPTEYTPADQGYTAWGGVNPPESYRRGTPPSLRE